MTLARILHKVFTVAPKPSGVLHRLRCPTRKRVPPPVAQRTQDGVFDASLQKPMHNPGLPVDLQSALPKFAKTDSK